MSALTRYQQIEYCGHQLWSHRWIFAKTMPENPHEYTLRREWSDDNAFVAVVQAIRREGYQTMFKGYPYTKLDINGYSYWSMGAPVSETILINRAVREPEHPYDLIAENYDGYFQDEASIAQDRRLVELIGSIEGKRILDVGCGTGFVPDYWPEVDPKLYTGIDPSIGMLRRFVAKHSGFSNRLVCTGLDAFVGSYCYDLILALWGTGSYLSRLEIERIPLLLNAGGRAIVTTYQSDYTPVTYVRSGIHVPYQTPAVICLGEPVEWEEYLLYDYQKPADETE